MTPTRVVLSCGTGGVGKTTTSAALGIAWALAGHRAVVLTIDPARRLADAFGLTQLDNQPRPVALGDLPPGGSLHALMLDRKATFDDSIRRLSPDPDSARRLLENRYYRAVSTRLTGAHEYMATEKLHELVSSGMFDVVIVDTPPSRHAIEFFHAPQRVQTLFDGPIVRKLVNPGRGLTGGGTRKVLSWVLSMVGSEVIEDIGEFFRLMSGVSEGFARHGAEVERLLRSDRAELLVVTTPASHARAGALSFVREARQEGLRVAGFVLNRTVAPPSFDRDRLSEAPKGAPAAAWAAWRGVLFEEWDRRYAVSQRHAQAANELARLIEHGHLWTLPRIDEDLGSAEVLRQLAARLPPLVEPSTTS
jgi:anion-transporting  ArsA/GET3 family ATPase